MEKRPERKKTRLDRFSYSSNAAYFLTICVKDKKKLLGEIVGYDACDVPFMRLSQYGQTAEKHISLLSRKYYNVFVDKYVLMPNHLHL